MRAALEMKDASGLTLRDVLRLFLELLAGRCGPDEWKAYTGAVRRIQTGMPFGTTTGVEYEADELQGATAEGLVPNVRLVNGTTRQDTRQRLMLTFNDLRWNPSDLEQRTRRLDRTGAKAEQAGRPVQVDIPFVAQTQDEKLYRVVTDRERWFGVLVREEYAVDARSTEAIAARIPLPAAAAGERAFRLAVNHDE